MLRVTRNPLSVLVIAVLALWQPVGAAAELSGRDASPFPHSRLIAGAAWTSPRYGPPANQWGDIMPTAWADDGNEYAMVNDGATDVSRPGALWRQSVAEILGRPPAIRIRHVGDPNSPRPHTFQEIAKDPALWSGPLGPYYSSGLVDAGGHLFATRQRPWNWAGNGPFTGLVGTAYSGDHGAHWTLVNRPFPAPLGNLSFVVRGQGGVYPDGYIYAIASEREFNASTLLLGRTRTDVRDVTDPARWQWASALGATPEGLWPTWSSSLRAAAPIIQWEQHITYPQVAYDSPLHRYLLTFSYSYSSARPAVWKGGVDLVILEAPHPWGPFSFVAHESEFGPSNGYAAGFPISWISRDGSDLWMKWSANFDGCDPGLDCSGGYGFNYRRLHLRLVR
ncbi:MAG: hypothetical protein ACYC91_04215 [Solirubrobacteraceae bacterium]